MKKIKVSYLGLNSLFGRVTTNLLKQSPCIHKLTLYGDEAPLRSIDCPHVFYGRENIQDAIKDVNIVVIGEEGSEAQEGEDRIQLIGSRIVRYSEAILKFCPNAIIIVAASPLNILFPLVSHLLGPDWNDRLLGTTSIDTMRASRALDRLLNKPHSHILPVVGGASDSTRVPLFSHICPQVTVGDALQNTIINKMRSFDCSTSQDMDVIERAYTTVRFVHSVLLGMTKDTSVPEIAMAKTSSIPQTDYFSLPILIGRKGIERAADLPKLGVNEEKLFYEATQTLAADALKAVELRKKLSTANTTEDTGKANCKQETSDPTKEKSSQSVIASPLDSADRRKKPNSARKIEIKQERLELPTSQQTLPVNDCREGPQLIQSSKDDHANECSDLLNSSALTPSYSVDDQIKELVDDADGEFSETLQSEVEEHLNTLRVGKQLEYKQDIVNGASSGEGSVGTNELECMDGTSRSVVSSSDHIDESGPVETSMSLPTTPSSPTKKMNEAIKHSKSVKFVDSKKSTVSHNHTSNNSTSGRINDSIVESRGSIGQNTGMEKEDRNDQDLDKDAKRELRPDDIPQEKSFQDIPIESVQDDKKTSANGQDQMVTDPGHTEMKTGNEAKNPVRTQKTEDPAEEEIRSQDEEYTPGDEVKNRNVDRTVPENVRQNLRDNFGVELTPDKMSVSHSEEKKLEKDKHNLGSSIFPKIPKKQRKKFFPTSKLRGNVNTQVVNSFLQSTDHVSGNKIMMNRRKQKEKVNSKHGKRVHRVKAGESATEKITNENEKSEKKQKAKGKRATIEQSECRTSKPQSQWNTERRGVGRSQSKKFIDMKESSDEQQTHGGGSQVNDMTPDRADADAEMPSVTLNKTRNKIDKVDPVKSYTKHSPHKTLPQGQTDDLQNKLRSLKILETTVTGLQQVKYPQTSSQTAKRIDCAIANARISDQQINQSPKVTDFKLLNKQPGSNHLLTDLERVAKLNSIHQTKSEDLNAGKTSKNDNIKPELSSKNKPNTPQKIITNKPAIKDPSEKPKSQKSAHKLTENETNNDAVPNKIKHNSERDLTPDKTMNYFINQKEQVAIVVRNTDDEKKVIVEFPKHKRSDSKDSKSRKRQRHRQLKNSKATNFSMRNDLEGRTNESQDMKNGVQNPKNQILDTEDIGNKKSNPIEEISPRKEVVKPKKANQETGDPWDSKYFTKASEMFFKMFRDTVSSAPPKCKGCGPTTNDLMGPPNQNVTSTKGKTIETQLVSKTDSSAHSIKDMNNLKNKKVMSAELQKCMPKIGNQFHQQTTMCEASSGGINFRFEEMTNAKYKSQPEASRESANPDEQVQANSKQPTKKDSPTEEKLKQPMDSLTVEALYEESLRVPTFTSSDKSWTSSVTYEKGSKYLASNISVGQSVVATSDKGRGEALNKVDFRVCKVHDQNVGREVPCVADPNTTRGQSSKVKGPERIKMKIPIVSQTIKQVPTLSNTVKNVEQKLEKPQKWERIVNVFKNIIIDDIERKRNRLFVDVPSTTTTANISKTVVLPPTKFEPKNLSGESKKVVLKVRPKSGKQGKCETTKKKRSNEPKRFLIKKHNPKKIVNYFSKRGASSSVYNESRNDGPCLNRSEGLMAKQSANVGASSSFTSPTKIR